MSGGEETPLLPASMDIAELVPSLAGDGWRSGLRETLHRVLGIYETYQLFSKARDVEEEGGENVFLGVLRKQRMVLDYGDLQERIPREGSVVIVANHPFGGADAIALTGVCAEYRPDTKVLANAMSSDLSGTAKWTIPLHIMGESGSTRMNRLAMKVSLDHLRSGGLLVVFPAGAVSRWRNDLARIADPEWSQHIARLVTKTSSPVLPVRFFGNNPLWFELLGTVHPMLRSALIVRTFLMCSGKSVRFRAGKLLMEKHLSAESTTEGVTQVMRNAVESIVEP